jgi:hypothetical protein
METRTLAEQAQALLQQTRDFLAQSGPAIKLDGPFEDDKEPAEGGTVSRDWPAVGLADAIIASVAGRSPYPYPVTVYLHPGQTESGIVGVLHPDGQLVEYPATPAPHVSEYWDDDLAKFVPSVVVWSGVVTGGVRSRVVDGQLVFKRSYDGTLLGEWPTRPPRETQGRDPEKARLAALEKAA